jgi:hypothetical protein
VVVGVLGLTYLHLDGRSYMEDSRFTDATCRALGQMSSLTHLGMFDIKRVTDVGIEALASLTALTSLTVEECDEVRPALCCIWGFR